MSLSAILFGSVGTLVETSELQRRSFNEAFKEAGLDWNWDSEEYRELLKKPGGQRRIADYAEEKGVEVDARKLHARKTEIYNERMKADGLTLRPGVADVLGWAKSEGVSLGFASSSERDNIDSILSSTEGVTADDFAFIGDRTMVDEGKPDPAIYDRALEDLGVSSDNAIAIEDTLACFHAPRAASIPTIAFPNENAETEGFDGALAVTDRLTISHFQNHHLNDD